MELGGGGSRNVSKAEDQDGAQAEAGPGGLGWLVGLGHLPSPSGPGSSLDRGTRNHGGQPLQPHT